MVVRNAQGQQLKTPARTDLAGENSIHRKIESDLPADPEIDTEWIYQSFLNPAAKTVEPKPNKLIKLFS